MKCLLREPMPYTSALRGLEDSFDQMPKSDKDKRLRINYLVMCIKRERERVYIIFAMIK